MKPMARGIRWTLVGILVIAILGLLPAQAHAWPLPCVIPVCYTDPVDPHPDPTNPGDLGTTARVVLVLVWLAAPGP